MAYNAFSHTFTDQATKTLRCYLCQIEFVVPESLYLARLGDKRDFWCPVGHSQHFIESMKDKLAREQHRREQAEERAADMARQRDQMDMRRRGTLGALRKVQKRVKHGVCPCCSRSFTNLARHMSTKHPSFGAAADE